MEPQEYSPTLPTTCLSQGENVTKGPEKSQNAFLTCHVLRCAACGGPSPACPFFFVLDFAARLSKELGPESTRRGTGHGVRVLPWPKRAERNIELDIRNDSLFSRMWFSNMPFGSYLQYEHRGR